MDNPDRALLRVSGWSPVRLPGEHRGLQAARNRAREILLHAGAPSVEDERPEPSMTDIPSISAEDATSRLASEESESGVVDSYEERAAGDRIFSREEVVKELHKFWMGSDFENELRIPLIIYPILSAAVSVIKGSEVDPARGVAELVRDAIESITDFDDAEVVRPLFGLTADTHNKVFGERRVVVSRSLGISSEDFRKKHQRRLLEMLANKIMSKLPEDTDSDTKNPRPPVADQTRRQRTGPSVGSTEEDQRRRSGN